MRGHATTVIDGKVDWAACRQLLPYLLEFRLRILLALLCLVGAKIASVGGPFLLKHIVDALDVSKTEATALSLPIAFLLAYGFARFATVMFGELRDTVFGRVTERVMRRIGLVVFKHVHSLDLDFHLNRRTGGLSRDIERGVNGVSFILRFMVFNIVPTIVEIALVIGLLWWNYSYLFALIVFLAVVFYVAFSVVATDWRTRYVRDANNAESRSSTRSVDSLMNYETVKYFTNEAYEAEKYDSELALWETARRNNRLSLFALNGGQALIIALAMTIAMLLAGLNVLKGSMTLGDFVLINAFMMQIFMPLNFLGFVYREMKGSMANIESMFDLLKKQASVREIENAPDLELKRGMIEFQQVSFRYASQRPILESLSFIVPARQKLAIVGSSGAGKSTILKLLFRFYDPDNGKILIDGQDIGEVTLTSLRKSIGVVPQDTVLFNTSILENIRYGRVTATDEEVREAMRMAHLEGFVEQLPEGIHTLVGERGLKLSGGEKQRVAIARTILKRPPIIVFDEATSSLDSKSEQSILTAIREISADHTSVVVAHRLSTIVDADNILVLEEGKIVEQGSHTQLINRHGRYAQMWAIQQQEQKERDSREVASV